MSDQKREKVIIVGAGLCGTLAALVMSSKGYQVDIYEKRGESDIFADAGRSFNITLTERGFRGMRLAQGVNLEAKAIESGRKCFGRWVHPPGGGEAFWTSYGNDDTSGKCFLLSISRTKLNQLMTRDMLADENINVFFGHKCDNVDLKSGVVKFTNIADGTKVETKSKLLLGTDGSWSKVRQQMMRNRNCKFSQDFSEFQYKELYTMPDAKDDERHFPYGGESHANGLHLWPGDDCLLVAQPNPDKSYSTTIFATKERFDEIENSGGADGVRSFFQKHFPTALIGMDTLEKDYRENPIANLKEARVYPYHFNVSNKCWVLLLGDAAHAVYPYLGQGTNAAFEDVWVLSNLMQKHKRDWGKICPAFTDARYKHAYVLADLAKEHGHSLCNMSFSPYRYFRHKLSKYCGIPSPYEALAFSTTPYSDCIQLEKSRWKVVQSFGKILSHILFAVFMLFVFRMYF